MSQAAIAEKRKIVDQLKDKIGQANVMLISDYLGFTVKEITELRKRLRKEESEIKIIKNTLIERAATESGYEKIAGHLKGATAVILGYKDAVAPLKVFVKFVKEFEKGSVRIGMVDKNVFEQKELEELSKLPAKEVLIAKVVGGFQAPICGLVNVLQGPIRKLVYALNEIRSKKGGE